MNAYEFSFENYNPGFFMITKEYLISLNIHSRILIFLSLKSLTDFITLRAP
jgi:hypothetical protein